MKTKTAILFLLLFVFGEYSCDPCSPDAINVYFDIQSYEATTARMIRDTEQNLFIINYDGNTITYDNILFKINSTVIFYSSLQQPSSGNNAYACSPAEIDKGTKEKLISVTITSTQDFDSTHPAGTNLVDVFDHIITDSSTGELTRDQSLESFITSLYHESPPRSLQVVLSKEPSITKEHTFTFFFEFEGAEYHSAQTALIKFE